MLFNPRREGHIWCAHGDRSFPFDKQERFCHCFVFQSEGQVILVIFLFSLFYDFVHQVQTLIQARGDGGRVRPPCPFWWLVLTLAIYSSGTSVFQRLCFRVRRVKADFYLASFHYTVSYHLCLSFSTFIPCEIIKQWTFSAILKLEKVPPNVFLVETQICKFSFFRHLGISCGRLFVG